MYRLIFLLCCCQLMVRWLPAQQLGGNPASVRWWQIHDGRSQVIFPGGLDSQARRVSALLMRLDSNTRYSLGDQRRTWPVLLQNQTTLSNAYVRLAPVMSELYLMPPQNSFSTGSLRWEDNLLIHEQRHMHQFSNFNQGFTRVFSFLFGQEGQLLANGMTIPDYFFEGDAVWQETLVSRQGRGRMPAFYNGLKSLWSSNRQFSWMQLRNGSLRKYYPDHYELGYPLVLYGYSQYGPDFWKRVTGDAVRFRGVFYPFNKAIRRYSGKSYPQFAEAALQWYRQQLQPAEKAEQPLHYLTPAPRNNVVDYLYPQYVHDDTLIVTRQSYRDLNAFCLITRGEEKQIRVKDYVLDDYFSYRNGWIVYAVYQSDPRWYNRSYSILKRLNIYTGKQEQLTSHTRYFSPDISPDGTGILAVSVDAAGYSSLHRLEAATGRLLQALPNPGRYFFTQVKYLDADRAVAAVRDTAGRMGLAEVDLRTGLLRELVPFSNRLIGYPAVQGQTVYFTMSDFEGGAADRIFSVDLQSLQLRRHSRQLNGVYAPAVNTKDEIVVSAFTDQGMRLARLDTLPAAEQDLTAARLPVPGQQVLDQPGAGWLQPELSPADQPVKPYRKTARLINFHSARPFADDPEYGYTFYSDNVLSTFRSELTYTYNRNEQSHNAGVAAVYAGAFPFLRAGVERSFSRKLDTGRVSRNEFSYNATRMYAGFSIPLSLINGRTFRFLHLGGNYNSEYVPFQLAGKEVRTRALNYLNAFLLFTHRARKPRQLIHPAWAQELSITYRDAFTLISNRKLVADWALYFPGLLRTHSLVLQGAWQQRDTLPDFFSKTFSFSRGYQDLNQRSMFKWGVNYHFPLAYTDWGAANLFFVQRIRLNLFYDHTRSRTLFSNGALRNISSRSTGAELYLDGKIWNSLAAGIGVRYVRLLDRDYLNPGAVNRWEIILPLNIIPD